MRQDNKIKNLQHEMELLEKTKRPLKYGEDPLAILKKYRSSDEETRTDLRKKDLDNRVISEKDGRFSFRGKLIENISRNPRSNAAIVFTYLFDKSIEEPNRTVLYEEIIEYLKKMQTEKPSTKVTKVTLQNALDELKRRMKVDGDLNNELQNLVRTEKGLGCWLYNPQLY